MNFGKWSPLKIRRHLYYILYGHKKDNSIHTSVPNQIIVKILRTGVTSWPVSLLSAKERLREFCCFDSRGMPTFDFDSKECEI